MDKINVIIKTTNACNLRCKYCYNSNSGYKTDRFSMEKFSTLLTLLSKDFREIHFLWHGGEPTLLGLDYYKQAVKLEKEFTKLKGVKITNGLQTNGTLLDKKWIKFFLDNDFKVGISFDGIDNSLYRQKTEETLKTISLMKKAGLKTSCLAVVPNDNYDLIENYKYFRDLGVAVEFSYMFSEGGGLDFKPLSKEKYVENYCRLIDYWWTDTKGVGIRLIESYIAMALGSYFRICANASCHGKFLSVYPDGTLYNCGRDNMSKFPFGNIDEIEKFSDIYSSEGFIKLVKGSIIRREKCKGKCELFDLCAGGCADCALSEGNLESPPEFSCYVFSGIYSKIKEKVDKIKKDKTPLSSLNPSVKRTFKRCMAFSDDNNENIGEDFI